ncbi:hypothetical protein B0H13DRAFT_1879877 [Mycena leptocephala]|nr:hypothetical protein B0H13DRAFT_1879877 [Mycena leptocephala]
MSTSGENSAPQETTEFMGVGTQNDGNHSPLDFWVYLNGLPAAKKQVLTAYILARRQAEDAELHALEQQRCKLAADQRLDMPLTNNSTSHSKLLTALRQGDISRSLAETDAPSLAVVALAQLSDTDRRRVERYLLRANREPSEPPKRWAAPGTTGSWARSGNRSKGAGAGGGRGHVKMLCWFKAGHDPRELDGFVENDLTSLEPHAGKLPTDIEMYHKEKKDWKWVPVCLKTPIPRRRGVKVLFFRKKGLTELTRWAEFASAHT